MSQLEERIKIVEDEMVNLEGVDRKLEDIDARVKHLEESVNRLDVWDQDHNQVEKTLEVGFL